GVHGPACLAPFHADRKLRRAPRRRRVVCRGVVLHPPTRAPPKLPSTTDPSRRWHGAGVLEVDSVTLLCDRVRVSKTATSSQASRREGNRRAVKRGDVVSALQGF